MSEAKGTLKRELGLPGAVITGLGSILGTGVFISVGIGAGITGPAVVLAIAFAALVATCNGMSSAQLAAAHPVSGGTYEYGYHFLNPFAGFTAGWMFLSAKSASAATAALGAAGYALDILGYNTTQNRVIAACVVIALLCGVTLNGMRRTSLVNTVIVGGAIAALCLLVALAMPTALGNGENFSPWFAPVTGQGGGVPFLEATALMFVAYTGYGRIATLGEEVREPRKTIPPAIIATLVFSMLLYISIAVVAVGVLGSDALFAATQAGAPLEAVARALGHDWLAGVIVVGALMAMLGVLLNLILGLSRVALAMGRRGDMPSVFGNVSDAGNPVAAILLVSGIILGLALVGDIKTTWSFSAFTVLIYYALTNLAALRIDAAKRLFPKWISWLGLIFCAGLAFFVEPQIWMVGIGLLVVGWLWFAAAHKLRG